MAEGSKTAASFNRITPSVCCRSICTSAIKPSRLRCISTLRVHCEQVSPFTPICIFPNWADTSREIKPKTNNNNHLTLTIILQFNKIKRKHLLKNTCGAFCSWDQIYNLDVYETDQGYIDRSNRN